MERPYRRYRPIITELPQSDPKRDAGLDERIRGIVEQNVGKLSVRYDGRPRESKSSGFLTKYNDRFFIVTARHCINPNYGGTNFDPHPQPYITRNRFIELPGLGKIPLDDAKYFPLTPGENSADIAVMIVPDSKASQFTEESGLDILPYNEVVGVTDVETKYFAGFPQNKFMVSTTQAKMNGELGSTKGVSGGPVFIINNGKVKVLSIISGTDDDGKFVVPSPETFATDVHKLCLSFN